MAPSKLSPAERAFRKREAARLRQQRCRERKRQACLKKKLEEQQKTAEFLSSSPPLPPVLNKVTKSPCHSLQGNEGAPLPPLLGKPSMISRRYSSQGQSITECESFPSISSEQPPSSDASVDTTPSISSGQSAKITPSRSSTGDNSFSPKSIVTDFTGLGRSSYVSSPTFQILRHTPTPPLLTIDGSHRGQTQAPLLSMRPFPQQTVQTAPPNNVELDAVHAMLSLKSESPKRSMSVGNVSQRPPHMGFNQGVLPPFLNTMESFYHAEEDARTQQIERMIRAEAFMRARDGLNPGRHVYYHKV